MPLLRINAVSLYQQIANQLRAEIAAGSYDPSGKLPSEAALGERFAVSRVTVRQALNGLELDGLIDRQKGKGTFVAGRRVQHGLDSIRSFHEALRSQGMAATMRILRLGLVPTPPKVEAFFRHSMSCAMLRRLHLVDGVPIAVGISYLPSAIARVSAEEAEVRPTFALITDLSGQRIAAADLALGAVSADEDIARDLRIAPRTMVLVLERASYFNDGSGAEKSTFFVRPERYRFVFSSRSP